MPTSRPATTIPAALTLACLSNAPAVAQNRPGDDGAQAVAAEQAVVQAVTPEQGDEGERKADFIIAPAPFASPTNGMGLAVGAVALYNPNGTPHQWVTGGGLAWTTRGTRAIAAIHQMSSRTDAFRLKAQAGYSDQEAKYYGAGEADGDRGDPLPLENKKLGIKLEVTWRLLENVYAGVRYNLVTNHAVPNEDEDEAPSATPPPPEDELDSVLSMIGPTLVYDTRDDHTQPRSGVLVSAGWLFGIDALGNSYAHEKLTLAASAYFDLSPRTVIAAGATMCSATGDVPYYDLCLFGSGANLRGYPSGRYRDRASWAVQAEVRRQLSSRWGGTFFVGVGGIAASPGDFIDDGNLLPAMGVGVRYRLFKDNDAHIRLDFGRGKNDHGIYLGFGEAF